MLTVIKFGGSSVSDAAKIDNAARIAKDIYEKGEEVVIVVSAQGDMTDVLKSKSTEICASPDVRELDALLSTGEEISVSLMAMKLISLGIPAVSLCGWQAGILTGGEHGSAKIKRIFTERLETELAKGRVPVVAGFQGIDEKEDITTIGRGGSDTTAAALAAALSADLCVIYTDVAGVLSADPDDVPEAKLNKEIGYGEMLEMAASGAGVLHDRSVQIAEKNRLKLKVASSFEKGGGTLVTDTEIEGNCVYGVTRDCNAALLTASGGAPGEMLAALSEKGVKADMITCFGETVCFAVPETQAESAERVLKEVLGNGAKASADKSVSKLSLVGCGLSGEPDIPARFFSRLEKEGVPVFLISSGEIRISALIPEKDAVKAVKAIHGEFFGKRE
ncbi:MAG: aspartate kinase [Clostridia bacterium]|nr:aspartate kinase [Clostridia bacterium]